MAETPIHDELGERRLLKALKRGDDAAFERFVAAYTPALWRYASGQLRGHGDAVPDVVQSTLAAAVERLDGFRGDGPLGAWLMGICRFQVATYWRRTEVRRRFGAEGEVDFDRVPSPEGSPSETLEEAERRARVHGTLDLLAPPYGDVLEWKYLLGLSVREIASRLGVSPKAAESTLTRARGAFRRLFGASPTDFESS
ncbi:MAG: sigma-70 family RNA polymerase sigma factor [Acidobacteriota bacterium]